MKRGILGALFCILYVSAGAFAFTGSGVSEPGVLETMPPVVETATATGSQSLSVTFNEPMLTPGVATAGNYAVSGAGAGTLSENPGGVSGSGPYALTWSTGEMRNGATVTVTAAGVRDIAGNPVDPLHNSATCAGIGVLPAFSGLTVTPARAAEGDTVTIGFSASEPLSAEPSVTVNGHAAEIEAGKAVNYTFTYIVTVDDPLGMASIQVSGMDAAGNQGQLMSSVALEILEPAPDVPLHAWPLAAIILAAAGLLLRRRARMAVLIVALVLASTAAFADTPHVDGVTFFQGPSASGGTQVDIYFNLTAPNGPCSISVSLSKDGGVDGYPFPVTSISGDIANLDDGDAYHIVWDIAADYPNENLPNAAIKVTADDGLVQHAITCETVGNGTCVANPAAVDHGATSDITVTPALGWHIVSVEDSVEGAQAGTYTTTPVTTDRTVTATFAINTYAIGVTSSGNGAAGGGGTYDHGATVTLSATPDANYHFVNWTEAGIEVSTDPSYSFTASAARMLVGNFVMNPPEVSSFSVNNNAATTTDPTVTLNNTAANSPTEYMASESPTFSGASWAAYGTGPSFMLSSGAGGTKTVYFKVKNAGGESAPVSDTINLTGRTIQLPGSIPLVLVWVPSGNFQMGRYPDGPTYELDSYPHESPRHAVTLSYGFWMGKYEITQQQWLAVQGTWPGAPSSVPSSTYGLGNTYPAYYISWNDAKDFITTLNVHIVNSGQGPLTVRLPSEAEWEYACRAGTQTRFYWGDDLGYTEVETYAWYSGNNSPSGTKPVGGKSANAFGLHDICGNVTEWCEDDYHASYTGAPSDASAWIDSPRAANRIIRGGNWGLDIRYCRSAYRISRTLSDQNFAIGFRLAAIQSVPPEVTSFAINSGAATTNTVVTLDNMATNSPTQYMASESAAFSGATWQAYGTAPSFTLSAGAGGTKTVYFKVKNTSGESAPVSDTISLTGRTIQLPGSVPLELVWIPSGNFQMGRYPDGPTYEQDSNANESPRHAVTLAYGFWMGKYEITQQQWLAVQGSWPGTLPSVPSAGHGLGNAYPAYYISWDDAKSFITTLNAYIVSSGQGPLTVRLPSEAEWEFACRAGAQTRFYWGDDPSYTQIDTYAWYVENNTPGGSKAVGGKTANALGLHDMSGNVFEWCEDDYHSSYTSAPADGSAWIDSPIRAASRLFRSGSWDGDAWMCRSADRRYGTPGDRYDTVGFRVAAVQ